MRPPIAPALHSLFAQGWCQLFPSTAAPHWNHKAHRMTRGVGPHFFQGGGTIFVEFCCCSASTYLGVHTECDAAGAGLLRK